MGVLHQDRPTGTVPPEDLADLPAAEIGRHLAHAGGGAVTLAETLLERIARHRSPIFLTVTAKRALSEARQADARLAAGQPLSPLDGVPVAWKDLVDVAGERTSVGSPAFNHARPAARDAAVVQNAARAGMVTLGKLNLAEFAYSALGQNPHFGTPLNPHSAPPHAPGGSSSGSGVAVAARLVPVALGTDTGGSVRIPAAFCGVTGFKTSEGQVSKDGGFVLSPTQDTFGPMAHTLEDCALAYDAFRGVSQPPRTPTPLAEISVAVPGGLVTNDLDPAISQAFEQSLHRLRAAGITVHQIDLPDLDTAAHMMADLGSIIAAEAFAQHRAFMDSPQADAMDQRIRARIETGRGMTVAEIATLRELRTEGAQRIRDALKGAFLAMPTTPNTAPPLAAFEGDDIAFQRLNSRTNRNTSIGSFFDLPGLAIPNGCDAAGLPTSILISAPSGEDERLLRAGLSLEPLLRRDMHRT